MARSLMESLSAASWRLTTSFDWKSQWLSLAISFEQRAVGSYEPLERSSHRYIG
jgi:hypothetical protein